MRVLRLCSVFEPPVLSAESVSFDPVGGMQYHTGQLTRALDARGVSQTVVTTWRPGAPRRERIGDHSEVLRLGVGTRWFRQLYSLPAAGAAPRLAARADVVHVHLGEDLAVVPLGLLAARRRTKPLVLTVHCSLRHTLTGATPRALLLRTLGAALERWGEARADAVICLTPRLLRRLAQEGVDEGRLHVIPSGVDPRLFSTHRLDPVADVGRPRVLFVGRMAPQKGARALLRAFSLLNHTSARLVLVGDGPQRPELERAAVRLGIAGRTRFTGFVPHEEVPAFLAHADVLALPSTYEELGAVLVEAMQAGLPIVASRVGGIPELLTDGVTGRLVPPGDPAALASAIDEVLADPALARRLGEAARERASLYHWDILAGRVLDLYRSVARRR